MTEEVPKVRTRARTLSITESVRVIDENGQSLPVQSLWQDRRIILVFLRHFGCRFCKQQVAMVEKEILPKAKQFDIEVIFVSLGLPDQIAKFKEETGCTCNVYVDPDRMHPLSYRIFRLHKGKELVLGTATELPSNHPEVLIAGKKAAEEGFKDGGYPVGEQIYGGNVFQVGGVFVLGPGNSCDYAYRSQYAGDHPDPIRVLEAATGRTVEDKEFEYPSTRKWLKDLQADRKVSPPPAPAELNTKPADKKSRILTMLGAATALAVLVDMATTQLLPQPASLALLVVAVSVIFLDLVGSRQPPTKKTRASSGSFHGQLIDSSKVTLMTPEEIDIAAIDEGCLECDCSFVEEADVSTKLDANDPGDVATNTDILGNNRTIVARSSAACRKINALLLTNCYLREFLAKPHALLGRAGPTCPFVPKSLKIRSIYIGIVETPPDAPVGPLKEEMAKLVLGFKEKFKQLEPTEGPLTLYKAILLMFPNIPLEHAPELIDGTQNILKAEFVKEGMMIGEFHMLNNSSGLRNPDFYPLRTPHPLLAIRHMVPTDIAFLSGTQYTKEQRRSFLESYIARMKSEKGAKHGEVEKAQQMLRELE